MAKRARPRDALAAKARVRSVQWRDRVWPGGVAHVGPTDTIAMDGCWCGEPNGHDWPGKAEGAPHPR